MKKTLMILLLIFCLGLFISGCVSSISKEIRSQVDFSVRLNDVREDPENYLDKMVLWAGVIVSAENLKEGTLIEIVQKPTNSEKRPRNVDQSEGRFLALHEGYLDVAIYAEDREVTVAGNIKETRKRPLGEIEYAYPVIYAKEIHLWPVRSEKTRYIYPAWHYPSWYYCPYWRGRW